MPPLLIIRVFPGLLALLLIGLPPSLRAEHPLIGKARSFLGEDAKLDAVVALRFVGELEVLDPDAPPAEPAKLEILLQKPDRQRITATGPARVEVTTLDGYDAWNRVSDTPSASFSQVALLGTDQIKRLRASTFENLAFYRGLEGRGVRVEDRGVVSVDGIACRKLAFVHATDIVFIRCFDVSTGRLVLTRTSGGAEIREEGEIHSGGIRFPRRIVTKNELPGGTSRTLRVTFHQIEVNPELPADAFSAPPLSN